MEPQDSIAVSLSSVDFGYGSHLVIKSLTATLARGEILALVGPSGCGKSTLLRLVAGLDRPTSGRITFHDVMTHDATHVRYLFQDYDAFPWLTVYENVRSGSGCAPHPKSSDVLDMLASVGLTGTEQRYPAELSGGMRKRLALARCLVRRPRILLLDEPFSSLDIDTRHELYSLVQELWIKDGTSVLLVTHDLDEAIQLADRIIVSAPRPMRISETIDVPLRRPRQLEIGMESRYVDIRRQLIEALRSGRLRK